MNEYVLDPFAHDFTEERDITMNTEDRVHLTCYPIGEEVVEAANQVRDGRDDGVVGEELGCLLAWDLFTLPLHSDFWKVWKYLNWEQLMQ